LQKAETLARLGLPELIAGSVEAKL
jgi:hypothetical protein